MLNSHSDDHNSLYKILINDVGQKFFHHIKLKKTELANYEQINFKKERGWQKTSKFSFQVFFHFL